MYGFKIRYLASVYLEANDITYNSQNVNGLLNKLGDDRFVSIQAAESARQPDGLATSVQRIAFDAPEHGFQLVLLGKRFNFVWLPIPPDGKNIGDLDEFCDEAAKKLITTLRYFDRKAHRLALVREGFLENVKSENMDSLCRYLLNLSPTFRDKLPYEWDFRTASLHERSIAGVKDLINFIVTVKRVQGKYILGFEGEGEEFDQIRVDLDINTFQKKTEYRFGVKQVNAFFSEVVGWHATLQKEVESLIREGLNA